MKKNFLLWSPFLFLIALSISGCAAIGGIFKAGMWTGTIGVILILAIIIFIFGKLFSKNKNGS